VIKRFISLFIILILLFQCIPLAYADEDIDADEDVDANAAVMDQVQAKQVANQHPRRSRADDF